MRVAVIGGGIGGLALARALHRADIDVVVHDRTPTSRVREGAPGTGRTATVLASTVRVVA